ncbi:MAG: filamentous hemagglutinin N-terminal domain-containing protein, partial [Ramlibacter sp.]
MKHSRRTRGIAGTSTRANFAVHPLVLAICAAFATVSSSAWAQLPTGAAVVNGSAGIATSGSRMTITNSPNAVVNWKTFSIGAQNSVRFEQQNAASQVLNRVVGNDPSSILGSLSSNGGVWLVNPHGVLFGANARIDVGGLVASTLGITNEDFLSGRFRFEGTSALGAQVLNQAQINTSFGGRVWLMGDSVRNEGLVHAPGGNIVLAAGKSIELIDSGMPNVTVRVTAPENEALNLGTLIASGGGSIDLHGGIVNQQGIVRADSIGTDGAGRVVIRAQGDVKLGDASVTSASASGTGAGGKLLVESAAGTTTVTGKAAATSSDGAGGQIHLLGKNVGVYKQAQVDASGGSGGGEVLVGGDYQGNSPAVMNASATYVGADASLKANATGSGDGGKVIVWGNDTARVYGTIEAKGGAQGGNGGFVETSGGYLDAQPKNIDLSASAGKPGTWLLDPSDITIAGGEPVETPPINADADPFEYVSNQDSSVIAAWRINDQLARGTNVLVRTGTPPGSSQAGNIIVAANIAPEGRPAPPPPEPPAGTVTLPNPFVDGSLLVIIPTPAPTPAPAPPPPVVLSLSAPGSLTLQAHNDIIVQAGVSISSPGGPMPVTFIADSDKNNAGSVILGNGSSVSSNGGNIGMTGNAISVSGGSVDASKGILTLTGVGGGGASGVSLSGAQLSSSAPGTATTIVADRFTSAGSSLSTPNGRWLIYLGAGQASSFPSNLGGLDFQFVQFNAPFATAPALSGLGQNGVLLSDPLNVQVKVNANREYDTTVRATFDSSLSNNAPAGFTLQTVVPGTVEGTFQNKDVGVNKPISFAGNKFALRTAADRPVFGNTFSYVGDITQATLTFIADRTVRATGRPITDLTGNISGFKGAETLATATSGTLAWQT